MSSGRSALLVVVSLAAAGLLGALFVPLPRTVRCEYELVPAGKFEVTARYDGVLTDIASAGPVNDGITLARFDTTSLEEQRAAIEAQREQLINKLEGPIPPELLEAVAQAKTDLEAARAAFAKAAKKDKPLATARLQASEIALSVAREQARPIPSAQLEEPLAKLNAQLAEVSEQLKGSTIHAPRAGEFIPSRKSLNGVRAKEAIGTLIDSSTLLARVKLPAGETATQGRVVTLVFPLARKSWALTEDAKEGIASVEVPNADGALKAGATGVAELEGEPRPLLK